jgi:hypothetical protein
MKRSILFAALAATLLAAWFAPEDEGDVIAPASARTSAPRATPAAVPVAAQVAPPLPADAGLTIVPRVPDDEMGNLFGSQQWQNPSPLKPKEARQPVVSASARKAAATAAAASAPELPIRFLGRFIEDGKVAFFLQVGDSNVIARIGDKVGDHYRLDSAGAEGLTFTYMPLNQKQVLAAGDTN